MSGSALMGLGTSALFASYSALQTAGNNIANANTKGYSRQSVELQTAGGQFSGAGFFGKGVNVTTVSRAQDDFLAREVVNSTALASADSTRLDQLQQLEAAFPTAESGVGYSAGQFLNSFVDVASNPQDIAARQVALGDAEAVAARFRAAGQQMDSLQSNVTSELKTTIDTVNTLAKRLADLNGQISLAQGSGHQPNDLLDQRDQVIKDISSSIQVTTIGASDGSINLFIGGGQNLVLGGNASQLGVVPDEFDPSKVHVGLSDAGGVHQLPDNLITGGSIAGLLRFQNVDLTTARNKLGQMAAALAGKVNDQQALGLDLGTPANPGAPIFSTGAAIVEPSSRNAVDASGAPVASYIDASGTRVPSVSYSVTDASQLQASDYLVQADASTPGNYLVTRMSDGKAVSVASGANVDGFQLAVVAPLPAAGDKFLLRPVGAAAQNMTRVLDDPKGIAAASPVTASVGVDNIGTATISAVKAVSTSINPALTANINFTSDTGNYDWQLVDATNTVVSSGSATWTAGQSINLNGFQLDLNGVPKTGDTVTVAKTAFPATDNGNARAITALRDQRIVGQQGGSGGATVTDAYADVLSDVGVRVQSAKISSDMSTSVANDAQASLASKTGVNLDEEAAKLIQYQQSYQAAAKILQIAQTIFDALLNAAAH